MRSFWGSSQPPPGVGVDFSHPLGQGLVCAVVANAGAGSVVDAVKQRRSGTVAEWKTAKRGRAARDWAIPVGQTADLNFTGPWSVAVHVYVNEARPLGYLQAVQRRNYVSEANNQGFDLNVMPTNDNNKYAFQVFNNNGAASYRLLGAMTVTGGDHVLVGTSDGVTRRLYVDAALDGSTTNNPLPAACTAGNGLEEVNVNHTQAGWVYASYVWNRCLQPDEVRMLAAQPYAMFQAPVWSRLYVLTPQFARPASDIAAVWHDQLGGTTSLYSVLDEAAADDADYIESPDLTVTPSEQKVRLGALVDPGASGGHIVRYRYAKNSAAGDTVQLTVTLYAADGTTVIKAQAHTITETLTNGSFTLTAGEANSIPSADYASGLILGFKGEKL